MKILLMVSCLSIASVGFTGCEVCSCKEVACPAFEDARFIQWFPYTINQQDVFINNSLADTVTINEVEKSDAYEASRGCYGGSAGCNAQYYASSAERQSNGILKFSLTYLSSQAFSSGDSSRQILLYFYNFNLHATGISNEGLILTPGTHSSQYFPLLGINGNNFENVQVIMKDTTQSFNKTGGPYKIYIARNRGLIAWEDYPGLQTWIKQ